MRDLRYGIEIEMTGLSRGKAAETLAGFLGTRAEHTGGGYDAYAMRDAQGRVWKIVSDGSIQTQKKVRGQTVAADSTYSVELVSPVCVYEDIGTIQEIVRALRRNNALVNDSCGIHVHVGAEKFDAQHLRNITNIMASKEELIYKALQVDLNRSQDYCRRVEQRFLRQVNEKKPQSLDRFKSIWYNGRDGSNVHYHASRYHALNLHSVFQKGTVEFRMCALPGFVDSKNEEKTERNAGYLVVSHSGGGMLRQGTRKGIRRTPANRGMRAHWVVKGLDISEDVCHGMCP